MRTETQNTTELARICALIENISVAMLTTSNDEGALMSRRMSPLEMDCHGGLWFFTDRRSDVIEHLDILKLSFSDEPNATYVSLSGRGEICTERERIERLWTAFAKLPFSEGPHASNLALLKFVPQCAEYGHAPHTKTVRLFASPVLG